MENWDPTAKLLIHSLQQDVISIPDIKLTFPCEELFKESQVKDYVKSYVMNINL